jgi:hypothetical protein
MLITELQDKFKDETIYIVGTGPTLSLFPKNFFDNKKCILLNNAYKLIDNKGPFGLFHSVDYIYNANSLAKLLPNQNIKSIKYPVVKLSKEAYEKLYDKKFPFYFYYYSHEIDKYNPNVISNEIYYSKDGSSLHAALQLANLIGATNILICGCDARTFSGNHYAKIADDGFRTNEQVDRNYDSYTLGCIHIINLLRQKGVIIHYLSPLIGYNSLDLQFENFSLNLFK